MKRVNIKDIEEIEHLDKGYLTYYKGEPFTGVLIEEYIDGSLKSEFEYENGLKSGLGRSWDENENLIKEYNYGFHGFKHGDFKEWHSNGQLFKEGEYFEGKKFGSFKLYNEKGNLLEHRKFITSLNSILSLDSNYECKVYFEGFDDWKNCHYQLKPVLKEIDSAKLPLLSEEYHGDTGRPLLNEENKQVYDDTQEIKYDYYKSLQHNICVYSKSFIRLFQEKINEFNDEFGLTDLGEFYDILGIDRCMTEYKFDELFYLLECNYDTIHSIKEEDELLWFTASLRDDVNGEISVELYENGELVEK
ncbi:hypothetical protein OAF16_03570 [Flavobacteriales bacterium]|nr:hypothetical protein [Flavobacteriales bacterium]